MMFITCSKQQTQHAITTPSVPPKRTIGCNKKKPHQPQRLKLNGFVDLTDKSAAAKRMPSATKATLLSPFVGMARGKSWAKCAGQARGGNNTLPTLKLKRAKAMVASETLNESFFQAE